MSRAMTALVGLCAWAIAGVVVAQEAATDRAQSFEAVQGAVKEDVPGGPLLVTAYGLILALLLLYLVRVARLQARAQADLRRLERAILAGEPAGQGGSSASSERG